MDMDFVESFKSIKDGSVFILVFVCYMSRFVISFTMKAVNVEDVIIYLKLFFILYRKLYIFYTDRDQHFFNNELRDFLRYEDIAVNFSPSESFKSTGMMEVYNKLLEAVLKKNSQSDLK